MLLSLWVVVWENYVVCGECVINILLLCVGKLIEVEVM